MLLSRGSRKVEEGAVEARVRAPEGNVCARRSVAERHARREARRGDVHGVSLSTGGEPRGCRPSPLLRARLCARRDLFQKNLTRFFSEEIT